MISSLFSPHLLAFRRAALWSIFVASGWSSAGFLEAQQPQERRPFSAHAPYSPAPPIPETVSIAPNSPSPRNPVLRHDDRTFQESRPALDEVFKILSTRQRLLNLNIWFPGAPVLGNEQTAQGAAVAQGVALRTGYIPVSVSSTPGIVPGKFNIAVGTIEQLRGMLGEEDLRAVSNGYLLLRRIPNRADTHLLIITGRTPEGVDSAILSLGIAREKLPGVSTASIASVVLPKFPPFLRREPLRADRTYTLQELQETGTVLTPMANRRLRIELMLPGDFSPRYEGDFVLDLHFSQQTRTFQTAERVAVRVNDLSGDIATGDTTPVVDGGTRASIGVPAKLFRQGYNVIDIDFPGTSGAGFVVHPDSTLSVPSCLIAPPLPDLQITARTAYPFIGQPDGSEVAVYLANRTQETLESTWTFLAKLAQISNTLLHAAEFHTAGDGAPLPLGRHVIAVGDFASIPDDYRSSTPADVFEEIIEAPQEEQAAKGSNLKDVIMRSRKSASDVLFETPRTATPSNQGARQKPVWDRHERGYLACFPPQENQHGWVLLLTAQTGQLLRQRTEELIHPSFWEKIQGGSVFWNHAPESLSVYTETPRPEQPIITSASDTFVEMPLGETYSIRTWLIATGLTLLILIVSLTKSLQKNSHLRDNPQS
jgi:hypothetical protein